MAKGKKFQKKKIGESKYINESCWLIKTLKYPSSERCRYCELKFRKCLFFQYLTISLILIIFLLTLSFLIEGKISKLVITSIFILVIVYGCFFSKSTWKIIEANFAQRKAREALEELTEKLEEKVDEQTKELITAYNKLKRTNRLKTEFLGMSSHQLRTPLTVIKGYLSMILEGDYGRVPPKIKVVLGNVFLANQRLVKIVGNLLDISRIDLGKMKLEKITVQMDDLLQSCCEEMKMKAKEKGLTMIYKKPSSPLPAIQADESQMRQVMLNLIDNAIRYTIKGQIVISVEKKNNHILVQIKDTGVGLSKNEQKDIFEGFTRGSAGINFFTEGAGLGLYVSKKYLRLHKGRTWAESPGKDKGSTFFVELPI